MVHGERDDRFAEEQPNFAGYQVYDMHYEKIGKVDDLFVDENDRPEYIGVKMGFLGTKSTLIPIELVRVNDRRQLVEVAAEKDAIKEGPTFGNDREITPEFERQVLGHYRVETRQASAERGAYGAHYPTTAGDERVDLRPGERAAETHEHSGQERPAPMRGSTSRERTGHSSRDLREDEVGDRDELRVQRIEEELIAGTRERETGGVNVRKRVKTDREQVRVPRKREEVLVDRVPVEGQRSSEVEIGDDEIRVPVIEEEIVVEKRPVVREEIRLRKEVVEDEEIVEEDVHREEVDIEDDTKRPRE